MTQPNCPLNQPRCGLEAGNSICPKCGLDVRVRYVSEEAGLLAASKAESQYWKSEAKENLATIERLERDAIERKKESESRQQADNDRLAREAICRTKSALSEMDGPIAKRLRQIVAEQLDIEVTEISLDKNFVKDLGADSLDTVELIMAAEDEFGLEIPDDDAERFSTFREVLQYVQSRVKP